MCQTLPMDVAPVVAPAVLPEVRKLLAPPAAGPCCTGIHIPASQGKASKFVDPRIDDHLRGLPVHSGEVEQSEGVGHPELCGAQPVDAPSREDEGDLHPALLPRRRKIEGLWSGETVHHARLGRAETRALEQEA